VELSDTNYERWLPPDTEIDPDLERLIAEVRQALVEEYAIGDPDDLDRLAAGVVYRLLSVDDDRVGWVLLGETEDVRQVIEVLDRDADDGVGYLELAVRVEA